MRATGKQSKKRQARKASTSYGVKKENGSHWVTTPSGQRIVVAHKSKTEARQIANIFNQTGRDERTVKTFETPKQINVFLDGGVIQDIQLPKGVRVTVYDYDVEGVERKRIRKDKKGDACLITEWEASQV